MTTVTYDVEVSMTIEIDAVDLIDEAARDIIKGSVDDIGAAEIHSLDITVA